MILRLKPDQYSNLQKKRKKLNPSFSNSVFYGKILCKHKIFLVRRWCMIFKAVNLCLNYINNINNDDEIDI